MMIKITVPGSRKAAACIVLLPVVYFFGEVGWFLTVAVRETFIKRGKDEQKENH